MSSVSLRVTGENKSEIAWKDYQGTVEKPVSIKTHGDLQGLITAMISAQFEARYLRKLEEGLVLGLNYWNSIEG